MEIDQQNTQIGAAKTKSSTSRDVNASAVGMDREGS